LIADLQVFEGLQNFRYLSALINSENIFKWWNKVKNCCRY